MNILFTPGFLVFIKRYLANQHSVRTGYFSAGANLLFADVFFHYLYSPHLTNDTPVILGASKSHFIRFLKIHLFIHSFSDHLSNTSLVTN